jgi:hypothetical protein
VNHCAFRDSNPRHLDHLQICVSVCVCLLIFVCESLRSSRLEPAVADLSVFFFTRKYLCLYAHVRVHTYINVHTRRMPTCSQLLVSSFSVPSIPFRLDTHIYTYRMYIPVACPRALNCSSMCSLCLSDPTYTHIHTYIHAHTCRMPTCSQLFIFSFSVPSIPFRLDFSSAIVSKYAPALPKKHLYVCMHACMYVCIAPPLSPNMPPPCPKSIYMYVCTHVCMHECMYACMYSSATVSKHGPALPKKHLYVCMHACMYVCIAPQLSPNMPPPCPKSICMCACIQVCKHASMYVRDEHHHICSQEEPLSHTTT